MAKKEITVQFKLQAPGGTATPAPPIGPALGQHGVNPGQFIQQFNAASAHLKGKVIGVLVTVYKDRTFSFEVKSPPASALARDALVQPAQPDFFVSPAPPSLAGPTTTGGGGPGPGPDQAFGGGRCAVHGGRHPHGGQHRVDTGGYATVLMHRLTALRSRRPTCRVRGPGTVSRT